jgi:hypothetical protein
MGLERVFLGANVLFSAAYRPRADIGRLWAMDVVTLITSGYAAEEARINLTEPEQLERLRLILKPVQWAPRSAAVPGRSPQRLWNARLSNSRLRRS